MIYFIILNYMVLQVQAQQSVFNLSICKFKAMQVQGKFGLHCEFQTSQDYIARPTLKIKCVYESISIIPYILSELPLKLQI